jgi:DNA polymerase-1
MVKIFTLLQRQNCLKFRWKKFQNAEKPGKNSKLWNYLRTGAFALAEQTGLSRTEAKQMIEAYFETYPKLKEYMAEQVNKARERGYVETILGRKRHLKDINSNNFVVRGHAERNAVNAPVQGSAADVVKMAMIKIQKELEKEKLQTKMLLQVHDELVFEAPIDEIEVASNIIKMEMENAIETQVPLLVEDWSRR